jgi:O-antigen ligase
MYRFAIARNAILRLPALDQTTARKVLLPDVDISAPIPAKAGGRVSAPAASTSDFRSEVSRLFWLVTESRFWRFCVDLYPILVAASLPWSTTAVVVFFSIWFIALIPTIQPAKFWRSLRAPSSLAPIVFLAVAVIGMLWADGPWNARLLALGPVAKLFVLPFLLYHFSRSTRAYWVFAAFLISCALLLAYSWIVFVAPEWHYKAAQEIGAAGVPVRNAIDQNQEFVLCALCLASVAVAAFRTQQPAVAIACGVLAAAFLCNVFFVALARTSLVYIVPLALIFAVRHFERRTTLLVLAGAAVAAMLVWAGSPYLRSRVAHIAIEYREYQDTNRPTSTGQRLEYWTQALGWIQEAPVLGHGTGSTKQLFDNAAAGKQGAWGQKIGNPHNQTLYVAIQWGLLGSIVLYAMWFFHYRLFRAEGVVARIGLAVVVENVFSSLLNSHLFDFHEGWLYVIGVGVAGGVQLGRLPESNR